MMGWCSRFFETTNPSAKDTKGYKGTKNLATKNFRTQGVMGHERSEGKRRKVHVTIAGSVSDRVHAIANGSSVSFVHLCVLGTVAPTTWT
jgi:hypothetical protein